MNDKDLEVMVEALDDKFGKFLGRFDYEEEGMWPIREFIMAEAKLLARAYGDERERRGRDAMAEETYKWVGQNYSRNAEPLYAHVDLQEIAKFLKGARTTQAEDTNK